MQHNHMSQSTDPGMWFTNEEFYWRSLASGVWLMLFLPVILITFTLMVNFSLFSPVTWISGFLSLSISLSTIGFCILWQACSVLLTISQSRALSVSKTVHSTNSKFFLHMLNPKQLVNTICTLMVALVSSVILLQFYLPNINSNRDNLNSEERNFVLLYSLFLGVSLSLTYYRKHEYITQFPVVQQKRFFRVKKALGPCLLESVWCSFKMLRLYYPAYILVGVLPQSVLSFVFGYDMNSFFMLGTVWNLCNLSLFWLCFTMSVAVVFTFKISNCFLQICNTQHYTFPIVAALADDQGKTLGEAMESSNPLLKSLAFHDYLHISQFKGPRRLQLFELSSPGNQPHVWNKTSAECLRMLESLRSELVAAIERKQQSRTPQQVSSPVAAVGMRDLFSPAAEQGNARIKKPQWSSAGRVPTKTQERSYEVANLSKDINSKEKKSCEIFDDFQLLLCCIEGLSNLVAASIKEDKYGVVQRKLPDILSELLSLLQACENYTRISVTPSTLSTSDDVETARLNAWNASSLKLALKTGLYGITTAFSYHIGAVRLTAEHKKRLHAFLEFVE